MSLRTVVWCVIWCVVCGLAGEQSVFAQRQKRNAVRAQGDGATNALASQEDETEALFPAAERPASPLENIVRQAQTAYQQQKYEECIDLTTQVLDANPRHSVARYHRASALIDIGRRDRNVQQIRSGIADAREALGIAGKQYLIFHIPYFYGLTSLAEFENKRAHADLTVSVATPLLTREDLPANVKPLVYFQRALAKMYLKDYQGAAADYGEAVKLDPKFQAAHFGRADAFVKAGNPAKARESFDLAVQMLPDDALVYNNRGTFNVQHGRTDAAIADFSQALELNPNFYMAALNRGFARTQKLEWFEAENDYLLSLQLNPKQALALRLLGTARVAQGKLAPASEAFTNAIALSPQDAENYAGRGFAKFFARDYAGAGADFAKAREIRPADALFALWKYAADTLGQQSTASADLEAFLKTAPATPNWHVTLSKYMLGQIDDETLLKTANTTADAKAKVQWLCEAHYFQGLKSQLAQQPDAAKTHFEECLKTNQAQLTAFIGAKLALAGK